MERIYVYKNKLFKETSIDLYVEYLLELKQKYLYTEQDCLDWIVYSPYFLLDTNFNEEITTISYGLIITYSNEFIYLTDYNEFSEQMNLSTTKTFEWYDKIKVI